MIKRNEKIAIFTVTYNRKPYCEKTLSSLLSFGTEYFDLFVYDNGSTDGTPEYLRSMEKKHSNLTVLYGKENIGATEGAKLLLRECVFDNGYAYIAKNDDDEILPPDWLDVFDAWPQFEEQGAILAGFRRQCTDHYFNGLQWVSRRKENCVPFHVDDYECYRSYIVPGFQFSTEEWWKVLYPHVSDYGHKFGGWDTSIAMAVRDLRKYCLLIYNRISIHFQKWNDHPEYTQFKFDEIEKVRLTVDKLRDVGTLN